MMKILAPSILDGFSLKILRFVSYAQGNISLIFSAKLAYKHPVRSSQSHCGEGDENNNKIMVYLFFGLGSYANKITLILSPTLYNTLMYL